MGNDQGRAAAPGDEQVEHRGVECQVERVGHPAAGGHLVAGDVVREVRSQVAVADRHPLGSAGGSRSEQHVRHVVGVETVLRQFATDLIYRGQHDGRRDVVLAGLRCDDGVGEQDVHPGEVAHGPVALDGMAGVDRGHHTAEAQCREVPGEGHQAAGGQQREPPGHATVLLDDLPRHVLRRLTQLPVGQRLAVDLQRGCVGLPVRGVGEPLVQGPVSHGHRPGPGPAGSWSWAAAAAWPPGAAAGYPRPGRACYGRRSRRR